VAARRRARGRSASHDDVQERDGAIEPAGSDLFERIVQELPGPLTAEPCRLDQHGERNDEDYSGAPYEADSIDLGRRPQPLGDDGTELSNVVRTREAALGDHVEHEIGLVHHEECVPFLPANQMAPG